ncbi:MAG: PilW family protein [Minisyncoccales bacterium]
MKKETNKGFTLVELLVSVFIFSVIIGGMVKSLLTSIKLQQKIIADQKMFAEVSFVLEYMGRTLRMAQKDVDGVCTGLSNYNYNLFDGDRTIRFINYDGECQEFSLTDGAISERIADTERLG